MEQRLNVLWLPGWFPSRIDFLSGDFIERHASAVSRFSNIVVLFVTKDPSLKNYQKEMDMETRDGLVIYRGYYNCPGKAGLAGKMVSFYYYFRLLISLYKEAKKIHPGFQLVHVHISLKQGLFAAWLKWRKGLKYVITEQNSWFMPGGNKFFTHSIFLKWIIKNNFKNAAALHVVSNALGNALLDQYPFLKTYRTIPNVVDTSSFHPVKNEGNDPIKFFTIAGDTWHKNIDGIIRGFSQFGKLGYRAQLHIAGPNTEPLTILAKNLDSNAQLIFHGALKNAEVAKRMQQCDAFIFFTRYETFGCVMAEALCCGKPLIASRIPVLEENLQEFVNAIFVRPEDENDLVAKLIYFTQNRVKFDPDEIAEKAAEKYNYAQIGNEIFQWYREQLTGMG